MQDIKDFRLKHQFDISSYKEFICNSFVAIKSYNL